MRLAKINKLTHTVLQGIVELHANVIAVLGKVMDTNRSDRLLVLQDIVDIEPKTGIHVARRSHGQGSAAMLNAAFFWSNHSHLCCTRENKE